MLTAVWTVLGVLKIIGLILLGLIGLLLVLLLLVLLVPIRYQAEVSFDKVPRGKAGVSWLCHIFSVRAVYEEKLMFRVRVLGFSVFQKEKVLGNTKAHTEEEAQRESEPGSVKPPQEPEAAKKEQSRKPEVPRKEFSQEEEIPKKEFPQEEEIPKKESLREREIANQETAKRPEVVTEDLPGAKETAQRECQKALKGSESKEEERTGSNQESPGAGKSHAASGRKRRKKKKTNKNTGFSFSRIYDKLKEKLRRIFRRLTELKEKKDRWIAFLKDPANQRTYRLLKRQLFKLIRHILPQKISGRICFGFEDPAKTGQILAIISPFYAWYARRVEVIPVFEESLLEGELRLRGRIRIGSVLGMAAVTLFDKNFRALLKKLLRA